MSAGDSLLRRALTDPETGLPNALRLRLELERALARSERYGFVVRLVTVRWPAEADITAPTVGRILSEQVRRSDLVARAAEREFRLLLTHDDAARAGMVAERLRDVCSCNGSPPDRPGPVCEVTVAEGSTPADLRHLLEGA